MDYTKEIVNILEEVLTERTFSLEIIEKIKALKDGFEKAQKEIEELKNELVKLMKVRDDLVVQNGELQKENNKLLETKEKVGAAEKAQEKKDYELAFQKQRADEMRDIVRMVFANPTTYRTRNRNYTDKNGYSRNEYITENEKEENNG